MDYSKIIDQIADTMKHGGAPLTEDQRMLLAGSVGVYLDRAYDDGRSYQAKLELQGRGRFIEELRAKFSESR